MFMASEITNKNGKGPANKQSGVGPCRFSKRALNFETSLSVADIAHHTQSGGPLKLDVMFQSFKQPVLQRK
jgi:hypothetical protein